MRRYFCSDFSYVICGFFQLCIFVIILDFGVVYLYKIYQCYGRICVIKSCFFFVDVCLDVVGFVDKIFKLCYFFEGLFFMDMGQKMFRLFMVVYDFMYIQIVKYVLL